MKKVCSYLRVLLVIFVCVVFCNISSWATDDTHAAQNLTDKNTDSVFEVILPHMPWFDDFPGMQKRRIIRALVPYSQTGYFIDDGVQRGISYEALKQFEEYINKKLKTGDLKIHVLILLTTRDQIIKKLHDGYGDLALGNYTITEQRQKSVDFSDPILTGVNEIVISGPKSPKINSLNDLSGREVWVRKTSSYYESLKLFNETLKKSGKKPILVSEADENLEDEDILEMLNAGLIDFTVVDSHLAGIWVKILDNIHIHPEMVLRADGNIAWMIRKDTPIFHEIINSFLRDHKKGSEFGNIIFTRYLKNTKWVNDSLDNEGRDRFNSMSEIFKKYASRYDFDWLMVAAQAYQESKLDQSKRSPTGAVGVMQILPSTASDPNVDIKSIENLENNIHAGTKYLRFMTDRYFNEPDLNPRDRMLFAFASYNAGPAKIAQMRKLAEQRGLDPDVWFRNVEVVVADKIGGETVTYVSNIYKYYIVYRMSVEQRQKRDKAKEIGK